MNISRIWALVKIVMLSHILNPFWWPRARRSEYRTNILSRVAGDYFKRYLPRPGDVVGEKTVRNKSDKIFTIWQQGEENAPPIVQACFRSIRRHCKQELVILDDKNLFDYIELPAVIMKKYQQGKIRRAHFADICRVELLYRHGGYWMDATDFAVGPIPKWISDTDFFMYLAGNKTGQKYMFAQNCFIRANRGSYLLGAWRRMILDYWMNESGSFDYFMHQLLFRTLVENDPRGKEYFAKMPHVDQWPTHTLWHNWKYKKFSKAKFDELTGGAFFQKTAYSDAPRAGTFSQAMTEM